MKTYTFALTAACIICPVAHVFAIDNTNSIITEKTGTVKSFKKNDDIQTMLSRRLNELRQSTRDKGYMLAMATTEVPRNLNSQTAVEEFYTSFKEANALAVINQLMAETRAKISSELRSTTGANKGSDPTEADRCASEYLEEQQRLEREKAAYESSLLGTLDRIASKLSQDEVEKQNEIAEKENEKLNELIVCQVRFKAKDIKNTLTKAISGGVYGIRIMETLVDINNGRIGVIVGRSPETTEDAGQLKVQNLVAKPLPTAFQEAQSIAESILEKYEGRMQEPPFGLIGVRGMRLSNGEIVYFGFGTSMQKSAIDEIDNMENSLAIEAAQTKSLAALNEFAYMSASSDFSYDFEKIVEKIIDETLDMAKNGEVVDIDHQLRKELRATMTRNLSAKSSGFLKNPQELDTSAWSGGDLYPDFYLSIFAWSPSIMTNASLSHDQMVQGYQSGKTTSMKNNKGSTEKSQPPSGVKSYSIKEDW